MKVIEWAMVAMAAAGVAWGEGEALSRVGETEVGVADAVRAAAKGGYAIRDGASAERALSDAEDFALLAEEARKEGIFGEDDIVQAVRTMAVQRLLARKVGDARGEEPDEAAMRAWYEANVEEFTRPAVGRGRVLEVSRDASDWESRVAEASAWLAEKGGAGFAEAVKQWSTDAPARAEGGVTGWLAEGQSERRYPAEVAAALFGAGPTGAVEGPLETERAVYWVQRLEVRPGQTTPFEAAWAAVARRMAQEAQREAYRQFVDGLREGASVERAEGAAERLLEAAEGEGRPPAGPGPASR
ncbi:MAG: peptidyl-prolyl cis-trans isomerase [Kiritimatiellae bacterium]|nr:peptidyl-prolyl cis-trans isomerase [Kiritimatiellia bacterium]